MTQEIDQAEIRAYIARVGGFRGSDCYVSFPHTVIGTTDSFLIRCMRGHRIFVYNIWVDENGSLRNREVAQYDGNNREISFTFL